MGRRLTEEGKIRKVKRLVKDLGTGWEYKKIDFEPCPYKDFGTGFDIEVSKSYLKHCRIYMWYGYGNHAVTVKDIDGIPIDNIPKVVDELEAYTKRLFEVGFNVSRVAKSSEVLKKIKECEAIITEKGGWSYGFGKL